MDYTEIENIVAGLAASDPIERQDYEVCHYCSEFEVELRRDGEVVRDEDGRPIRVTWHRSDCLWRRAHNIMKGLEANE